MAENEEEEQRAYDEGEEENFDDAMAVTYDEEPEDVSGILKYDIDDADDGMSKHETSVDVWKSESAPGGSKTLEHKIAVEKLVEMLSVAMPTPLVEEKPPLPSSDLVVLEKFVASEWTAFNSTQADVGDASEKRSASVCDAIDKVPDELNEKTADKIKSTEEIKKDNGAVGKTTDAVNNLREMETGEKTVSKDVLQVKNGENLHMETGEKTVSKDVLQVKNGGKLQMQTGEKTVSKDVLQVKNGGKLQMETGEKTVSKDVLQVKNVGKDNQASASNKSADQSKETVKMRNVQKADLKGGGNKQKDFGHLKVGQKEQKVGATRSAVERSKKFTSQLKTAGQKGGEAKTQRRNEPTSQLKEPGQVSKKDQSCPAAVIQSSATVVVHKEDKERNTRQRVEQVDQVGHGENSTSRLLADDAPMLCEIDANIGASDRAESQSI